MRSDNKRRLVPAVITQLRAEIEALPQDGGGKRKGIRADLKRRVVEAWTDSGRRGCDFAREVAISQSALVSWRRKLVGDKVSRESTRPDAKAVTGFKRMGVVGDSDPVPGQLTIEGPNGLRVTGLATADLAQLWRALC